MPGVLRGLQLLLEGLSGILVELVATVVAAGEENERLVEAAAKAAKRTAPAANGVWKYQTLH